MAAANLHFDFLSAACFYILCLSPAAQLVTLEVPKIFVASNLVLVHHAVQGYKQGGYAHEDPHRPPYRHSRDDPEVSSRYYLIY